MKIVMCDKPNPCRQKKVFCVAHQASLKLIKFLDFTFKDMYLYVK